LLLAFLDCLVHIAHSDGLLAWWNGLLPSLVLVSNPAVNFMIYEALKRNVLPTLTLWVRKRHLCVFSQKLWCIRHDTAEFI